MTLTYILIDFENVQPSAVDMSLIRGANYHVRLFHGPHQNRFDADIVKALQPLGVQLEYVQCERRGKNALDFHIAFYLGRLVQEFHSAVTSPGKHVRLVIVSKDSGFDALLGHVQALGFTAERAESIREAVALGEAIDTSPGMEPAERITPPRKKAAIGKPVTTASKTPTPKAPPAKSVGKAPTPAPNQPGKADPWLRTLVNLRDHPNNRPATPTALERHLATLLGNGATEAMVRTLIARLQREGVAVVNGNKIEYKVPHGKS